MFNKVLCSILVCTLILSGCTNSALVTNESSSHKDTTTVKDVENIENYKMQYDAFIENVSDVVGFTIAEYLPFDEFKLHKMFKSLKIFSD